VLFVLILTEERSNKFRAD